MRPRGSMLLAPMNPGPSQSNTPSPAHRGCVIPVRLADPLPLGEVGELVLVGVLGAPRFQRLRRTESMGERGEVGSASSGRSVEQGAHGRDAERLTGCPVWSQTMCLVEVVECIVVPPGLDRGRRNVKCVAGFPERGQLTGHGMQGRRVAERGLRIVAP